MSLSVAAGTAIAAGISAIAGGGSAIAAGKLNRKNRQWQEKMKLKDQAFQKEYSKYIADLENQQNAINWQKYNSPAAQRAAAKAAGVNPFMEGSALQPMGVESGAQSTSSPSTSSPSNDYNENFMSNIQPGLSSFAPSILQAKQMDAQTSLINAQRAKVEAETVGKQNENSLFPLVKAGAESDLLSKKFRNKCEEVQAEFARINAITDLDQKNTEIAALNARIKSELATAAKTDADRIYLEAIQAANIANVEANTNLTNAKTETENATRGAKVDNLKADTYYKNVLARVEDSKLEPFLREMESRINKINQEKLTEEQRTLLIEYQAELQQILTQHERGPAREFLRKVSDTGKSLWSFILPSLSK